MKHLWIIELKSSVLLFYHNYTGEKMLNEYIISGLLGALNSFSESELANQGLESIDMGNLRWVYLKDTEMNLLLVAAGAKTENAGLMTARLDVIRKMFIKEYKIVPEFWKKGPIETSQFETFGPVMRTLQDQWQKADKVTDIGIIFDVLGIYQQIFIKLIQYINEHFTGLQLKLVLTSLAEYQTEVEKYLQDQEVTEEYRVLTNFIPIIDLKNFEIKYFGVQSTDVFGTEPVALDHKILRNVFSIVLQKFRNVIEDGVGETRWFKLLITEIKPILLQKWDLLEEMHMVKELLLKFIG
jgi:hypothetical protein